MTALATQYTCGEGDASTRRGEVSCEPVCRYLRASWWRLVCASCVAWSVSPAWRRRARLPRLPASRGRAARRREQREEEIAANRSAVRRDRMMLQKICTTKVETLRVLTGECSVEMSAVIIDFSRKPHAGSHGLWHSWQGVASTVPPSSTRSRGVPARRAPVASRFDR